MTVLKYGRPVRVGERVHVYRNLNESHTTGRVTWSVRCPRTRHVLAHVAYIVIRDAECHIEAGARTKVLAGGPRSVHAYLVGEVVALDERFRCPAPMYRIQYNPRDQARDYFYVVSNGARVERADLVRF